jgi:hypothetical protein
VRECPPTWELSGGRFSDFSTGSQRWRAMGSVYRRLRCRIRPKDLAHRGPQTTTARVSSHLGRVGIVSQPAGPIASKTGLFSRELVLHEVRPLQLHFQRLVGLDRTIADPVWAITCISGATRREVDNPVQGATSPSDGPGPMAFFACHTSSGRDRTICSPAALQRVCG